MSTLAKFNRSRAIGALSLCVVAGSFITTAGALAQNSSPNAAPGNTPARAPSSPALAPSIAPSSAPRAPSIAPAQTRPTGGPGLSPNRRPGGLPRVSRPPEFISGPNLYITPTAPALVGPGYNRPPMRYYEAGDVIRPNRPRNPSNNPRPSDYIGPRIGPRFDGPRGNGDSIIAVPYDNRSGVSIRGDFATDNFRLGFSLNSGDGFYRRHWADGYGGSRGPCGVSRYSWLVWGNRYYDDTRPFYGDYVGPYVIEDPRLLTTPTQTPAPAPTNATPSPSPQIVPAPTGPTGQPIVLSAFDRAVLSIRDGELDESANALREHLRAFPRDVVAMRLLALAHIGQRQNAEGVALIVMAYQLDPTLAYRPVSVEFDNADDPRGPLARISESALAFAQKQGTSSSWLAAIVTLQGLDRKEPALRLVKRAEDNGLEARIADELRKALQ